MRALGALAVLTLLSGCAGILRAPAEGRAEGSEPEAALLAGMNLDLLGPHVRRVEVEVDWVEGWEPGEPALGAMRAELRRWVPAEAEIAMRVDPPIPAERWTRAQETFAATAALVQEHADPPGRDEGVTGLHVVYVPTLRPLGQASALGVMVPLPHDPEMKDVRTSVLLGTGRIRKIATLWLGPRKVERTVLVHEVGHALGLVADGEHQHRGDPSHCSVSACVMVSSANHRSLLVGAPRALFLGRLPTAYCARCRRDLAAARTLYAARADDPEAWAEVVAGRRQFARQQRIGFLLQTGQAEAAVSALQEGAGASAPDLGELWTLARTLQGLGRHEEALAAGRALGPLDPKGRAVGTRAGPLLDLGRWTEALEEVERAKELGTGEPRLEMRALLGAGRVEEADARLRTLLTQVDPRARSWHLRERLWLWRAAGRMDRALEILAELPPRKLRADPALALEAGRLLLAAGRTEEGRRLLEPLARPKKVRHRGEVATLARARALTGDGEGALRAIAQRDEWFYPGERLLLEGEILAILGRKEEALTALEGARRQGASPPVPCLDPDLAPLRGSERFQALYGCRGSEAGLPTEAPGASLPGVDSLGERVGCVPVDTSELLFAAGRLGEELVASTMVPDPEGPETFDENFDSWVATARARLLLDHARVTLAEEAPPTYAGWTASQIPEQKLRDAQDRGRVQRILSEGGYAEEWAPFVEAYRSFHEAALEQIPVGEPDLPVILQVNAIAQAHGLHRLTAELRIEPQDVAAEMLRILTDWREQHGGSEGRLFYACDGEVRFRMRHPLGPALVDALTEDPGNSVERSFRQLQRSFSAWLQENPRADHGAQHDHLQRTAEALGLLRALEDAGVQPP